MLFYLQSLDFYNLTKFLRQRNFHYYLFINLLFKYLTLMSTHFSYKLSDLDIPLVKRPINDTEKAKRLSVAWTIITFSCTSFGIGMLTLPISVAHSGIFYFMFLCILTAILRYHCHYALVAIGQRLKLKNFPLLISNVLKHSKWVFPIQILMFVNVFGVMVGYTVAMQQSLCTIFRHIDSAFNVKVPGFFRKLKSIRRFTFLAHSFNIFYESFYILQKI